MVRWFPWFQVATTCFSCSPPDLDLLATNSILCIHVELPLPPGDNPVAVNKYYYLSYRGDEAIYALKRNSVSCAINRRIVTVSTHHVQICGRQENVSDLDTDDNPSATNSPDTISVRVDYLVTKLCSMLFSRLTVLRRLFAHHAYKRAHFVSNCLTPQS